MRNDAFSLVELSIVLVILGLLTGGILAGQSLIHAAELRGVSRDLARYQTAIHTFRDKYFGLPGDLGNGYQFWTTNCGTNTNVMTTAGGCNGDADGIIEIVTAGGGEASLAWKHLTLAGLIEGSYDGSYDRNNIVPGADVPATRINQGMYTFFYTNATINRAALWSGMMRLKNILNGGAYLTSEWNSNPFLKPEDVWNIDTKLDDGLPGYGIFTGTPGYTGAAHMSGCTTGTYGTNLAYDVADSSIACVTFFALDGRFGPTM